MTKTETAQAITQLTRIGWREPEVIKYEKSWRVYVTDAATGYRKHFDSLEAVSETIKAHSFDQNYPIA